MQDVALWEGASLKVASEAGDWTNDGEERTFPQNERPSGLKSVVKTRILTIKRVSNGRPLSGPGGAGLAPLGP